MSNLQIIAALTDIVSKQNEIIHTQAEALAQVGAVCAEEQIASVDGQIGRLLGADELPFSLCWQQEGRWWPMIAAFL